ncbi:MAG: EamA family transporter [Opitutae bacterium]|nr:EamA family transporter [Opitutae bacterium]|tara:strand:+ start:8209 stop:9093 length:885 start_codon:yes stop_codon:yes gene_type:complete
MSYLAATSLLWAFSFGLIGKSLVGVDSFFVATFRLCCATLLFLPFLRTKAMGKKDCGKLMTYGAIQFGLMYSFYMKAFQYLPSHLVALFSISTPVYVVLVHDIRRRKFSPKFFMAAIISFLGAACLKAKTVPSGDFWIGFGLMQLAGLSFAYGQIAYRDWKRGNETVRDREVFTLLAAGGALTALQFSLFFSDWTDLPTEPSQWLSILYLGIVASGIGFFLWNKGASLSNPGTLAAFNNAVVPLAVLVSLFVFREIEDISTSMMVRLGIGSALIIVSVLLCKGGNKERAALGPR